MGGLAEGVVIGWEGPSANGMGFCWLDESTYGIVVSCENEAFADVAVIDIKTKSKDRVIKVLLTPLPLSALLRGRRSASQGQS